MQASRHRSPQLLHECNTCSQVDTTSRERYMNAARRRLIAGLFAGAIGLIAATVARADPAPSPDREPRLALVIGNAAYRSMPLTNPVNDARVMADTLRRLGFQVDTRENADQRQMKRAILDFGRELRAAGGVGLFYYAGHGMQANGENYLVPVDAAIEGPADVPVETVGVQEVLGQMKDAGGRLNIVILDACRNDPFSRRFRGQANQGLAFVSAPTGTIIAYATAPGDVASDGNSRNGLYTSKLVNAMTVPGLKIEEVFKQVRSEVQVASNRQQVPWENTSLTGEFYFTAPKVEPPPPPPVDREAMFWQSIGTGSSIADFQAYLAAYPTGTFAALARARIAELQERLAKPAPRPANVVVPPTGLLRLHVQPAGASVRIDGAEYGNGPDVLAKLSAGRHSIVVSKDELGSTSRDIVVTDGSSADVDMALDGRPAGHAPTSSGRMILPPP